MLTEKEISGAKAGEKPIRLYDAQGLYLEIAPSGSKWWRLKYRIDGKEKRISLGVYPAVTLKEARAKRDEMRKLVANSIDPSVHRKATKAGRAEQAANSFEVVAREYLEKFGPTRSEAHAKRVKRRFEKDVFPALGARPIADIDAPELLQVIRRVEARGTLETAHRILAACGQVFRYAIATARAQRDASADLRGALPPVKPKHFAAVTEPKRVGELLRALRGYNGTVVVQSALKLAPLVFTRPGELRQARWTDIDFDAAEWRFKASKDGPQHIVPLSHQALAILRALYGATGRGSYVFPSARSAKRPMSDNAVLAAMRRMGIEKDEMCGHGFRAMARTILDEQLGFPIHIIEQQLAHVVRDPLGRAYNRTAHLEERRRMMQRWADYLDTLEQGAQVIPLRTAR